MSRVIIEGSNGSGKSTIIKSISEKYDVISCKSVPSWFMKYIKFARSCDPSVQKPIYLIGHEANFYQTDYEKDYVFDRFFYSTIIRLNFELMKTVEETVKEILSIQIKPDYIFFIEASRSTIIERLKSRSDFIFNYEFFLYEKEVFYELSNICDTISIINNDDTLNRVIEKIDDIIISKKLFRRRNTNERRI